MRPQKLVQKNETARLTLGTTYVAARTHYDPALRWILDNPNSLRPRINGCLAASDGPRSPG